MIRIWKRNGVRNIMMRESHIQREQVSLSMWRICRKEVMAPRWFVCRKPTGNPFMTYLDMRAFFNKNTHLKREYRVRDENDQEVVVQVPEKETVTTNSPDGHSGIIAPLEGFFVEVKPTASSTKAGTPAEEQNEKVTITFGPDMQRPDKESENLRTRSAALCDEPTLFITAHRDGKQSSVALVKRRHASHLYQRNPRNG